MIRNMRLYIIEVITVILIEEIISIDNTNNNRESEQHKIICDKSNKHIEEKTLVIETASS